MSDKERIFVLIKELKYELIENFENYSLNDINEFIEDIIQIYIDNKCDFAEDYETKQKIYYNDIDVFIITKRKQIIEDINHKLLLNYNENFELSIIIS
jgi:HD-like signal output (HDOD) protein